MTKKLITSGFIFSFILCLVANSQDYSNAGSYMDYFSSQYKPISKDMWDYTSAIARGKNARKVDNRRKDLMQTTKNAKLKIKAVKPFEGDAGLRDTMVSFLTLYYNVLNEDYAKFVDLEEVAEQSYDQMEMYITLRRKTNEKIQEASDALDTEERRFAAAHHINIIENETKLGKKLKRADKAFEYYDEIYLLFFKSQVQESNVVMAMNKKDINAAEQSKSALSKYANEGLDSLKGYKPYEGDGSMVVACRNTLTFFKKEAELKLPVLLDFNVKKEKFDEIKSVMDSKGKNATKEEIADYNKSLKEYNALINKYNQTNEELNRERNQRLNEWNDAVKNFLDKHAS